MKPFLISLLTLFLFSNCNSKGNEIKTTSIVTFSDDNDAISNNIDSLLTSYSYYGRFSGTVLVAKKNQVIYEGSFGKADVEKNTVNRNESVYGIGSITKTFTATAILKLVQEGKLRLTDKLSTFFPALGETAENITIHHLLSMTSGIYEDFSRSKTYDIEKVVFPESHPISTNALVHYFGELTSDSKPGKKFDYSNINYILLAAIIEKTTGLEYGEYLKLTFWQPLGMVSTEFGSLNTNQELLSKPYLGLPTQHENPEFWHDSWVLGAGGIFSSASDLHRWMLGVNKYAILDSLHSKKLFTRHTSSYGYGWQIGKRQGNTYFSHEGGTLGYVCEAGFFPELDLYIVVLTNHTHGITEIGKTVNLNKEINREIQNIVFGKPYKKLPVPSDNVKISINGNYNITGFGYTFVENEGFLSIEADENSPSILDISFKQNLTENTKRFKKAQKIAFDFGKENFRGVRQKSELMLKVLISTKTLAQIWTELTGDKGEFISYNFYRIPCEKMPNTYSIRLVHEKKEVGLRLVLSKRGRIKGMHIDQQFSFNGPKKVEAKIINPVEIFIDGFKYGFPDATIEKKDGNWVLQTQTANFKIEQ